MQIPVSFASTLHQAHCCQLTSLQTWYGRRHVTTVICPRQLSLVVRAVAEESAVAVGQVVGRRQLLAGFAAMTVDTKQPGLSLQPSVLEDSEAQASCPPVSTDYISPGPFRVVRLPRLEHTCHKLFPQCLGTQCLLRLDVFCPKGGSSIGALPPYPVAVFTGGFLVGSSSYLSYAERLASWGYVTVLYDKAESAVDNLDDVISVKFIQEIIDWCGSHPVISRVSDTSRVYLCGHSRGGKLSVLAAAVDPRVVALCLLDPVDNTVWAPLGPGYPSGIQALKKLGDKQTTNGRQAVPLALIGSGLGGDCAPKAANFRLFYEACTAPAWMVSIEQAGHFQFLDKQSSMQRAVCAQGKVPDYSVRQISQAVMVAWAQAMVPDRSEASFASQQTPAIAAQHTFSPVSTGTSESIVHKALASVHDPFVHLQSRTKYF
ncbi:TPA: hypothetical protein ACH3X3_013696 [Trebouxia sp. C0006]